MTVVTCSDCGEAFEREIPTDVRDAFRLILERIHVCSACAERAEAEAEAEDLDRRRSEAEQQHAQKLSRRRLDCGIPERLRALSWDDVTPGARPEAIEAAQRWSRGELEGLFLTGPVGVGKTSIAAAAAWSRLEHGPVRWVFAPELLSHLALSFDSPLHERALLTISDAMAGALVLDDIDKARPKEYAALQLLTAIDNRVTAGKPLLVTSNLRLTELRDKYPHGRAITSRLAAYCDALVLEGNDRRLERFAS